MADTESNQDHTNDAAPSRASGEGERKFTQSELESVVRGRVKEMGSLKEALSTKEREAADATLRVEYLRDAVKRGLDIDVVDDLFDSYRAKPVDDRSAWFDKMAAAFKQSNATQTLPTKPPASPAKDTVSTSDKGSPSAVPRDVDSISNPNDLTRGDIERMQELHGEEEANRRIAARTMKWLSGVNLKVS